MASLCSSASGTICPTGRSGGDVGELLSLAFLAFAAETVRFELGKISFPCFIVAPQESGDEEGIAKIDSTEKLELNRRI